MDQGEGVEGAQLKEDPLDFALWKATKEGEDTAWDAPWGRGRPGWHIECSAMAEQLLGVGLDIHGGGNDLIFPHHENEAAQTRMARGAELASIWMHNGMLQMGEEKMAKSVGNIALLGDVLERWGRDAVILFFVAGHYRQPLRFADESLVQAQAGREAAARGRPAARQRTLAGGPARRTASASSRRSPRTSTRRARWPRSGAGSPRPTSARASATPTCARCSRCSRSTTCSTPPPARTSPTTAALELLARREQARAEKDWGDGRPDPRRARRARLGGPRRRRRRGAGADMSRRARRRS